MNALLEIDGLTLSRGGKRVLGGVDLALAPDTLTVLLGGNGAGKSTLLRCALGLQRPDAGRVRVLGVDPLRAGGAWRGAVGYVPDQADAYPWMTARDLFRFLGAQTPGWSQQRACELLERLGAPLERTFAALSRGEAAKAMLAAALAPRPRLLVLDECFERLAPPAREEVLRVVLAEAPSAGGAVLLATHDLDVAARAADRVVVLDGGRVAADVDVATLLEAPAGRVALPRLLRDLYPDSADDEVAA